MREAYQNEEDLKAVNATLEDKVREGDECWQRIAKKMLPSFWADGNQFAVQAPTDTVAKCDYALNESGNIQECV